MKEKLDRFFQAFRMNGRTVVRTMILVLSMVLVLALVGCGNDTNTDNPDDTNDPVVVDPSVDIENRVEPEPVVEPKDMEATFAKYKDVYAWLEVPDFSKILKTDHELSYPVAQHPSDRGYYLHRDLDGNNNKAGTIFSEATCEGKTINSRDLNDPVTVLYGHNQANRTMFGGLQSYAETLKFDDKAVVEVYQRGRRMTYRIFAGMPYDTTHIMYYHDFTDEQVFTDFFAALDKAATDKNYTGNGDHTNGFCPAAGSVNVDRSGLPKWGDKVLILSVCKNGDDAHRYLVMAKLTEDSAEPLRMTREEAEKAGLTDHIIGLAPAADAADGTDTAAPAGADTAKQDAAKTDTSKKTN